MVRWRCLAILSFASASCAGSFGTSEAPGGDVSPGSVSPRFAHIARRIDSLVTAGDVPAVSVAVSQHGRIVWETGFGFADREARRPATAHTVYPIASIAKSLTATAVMLLVERGQVDLDRPVHSYLGDVSPTVHVGNPDALTVRALLSMTGGIPHLWWHHWSDEPVDSLDAAALVRTFAFSATPPGTAFQYSNLSFGVLELLVARVSGKPFSRFLRDDVLSPLGLRHTAVHMDSSLAASAATLYDGEPRTRQAYRFLDPEGGAWALSSAHDLALLGAALSARPSSMNPRLLSVSTIRQMFDFSRRPYYALGWWGGSPAEGYLTVLADGEALGTTATLKILPEEGVVAVALINQAVGGPVTQRIVDELLTAILPDFPQKAASFREVPEEFRPRPFAFEPAWTGSWRGHLHTPHARVSIALQLRDTAASTLRIADQSAHVLRGLVFEGGALSGSTDATVHTAFTSRAPHQMDVRLRLLDGELVGTVTARSTDTRPRFGLPFFVRLTRSSSN